MPPLPRRLPAYRPRLEWLEDRLPPGDAFWGILLPLSGLPTFPDVLDPPPRAEPPSSPHNLALVPESSFSRGTDFQSVRATRTDWKSVLPEQETALDQVALRDDLAWMSPATTTRGTSDLLAVAATPPASAGATFADISAGGLRFADAGPTVLVDAPHSATGEELLQALNAGAQRGPQSGGGSTLGGLDLTVTNTEVTQAIQTPTNSVGLVAGKSTMVRVTVGVAGTSAPVPDVYGFLYTYQNGEEVPGSPFVAGPITAKLTPSRALEGDTLNFALPSLAGNVAFVPIVVSLTAAEANYSNNFALVQNLDFACRRVPTIAYVPTDYRPTGGTTPNLPDPALIAPGVGDAFVRGIYPTPAVNYEVQPGPPLLWTMNINTSNGPYLSQLNLMRMMQTPRPNFLYGWLPGNPFSGNGQAAPSSMVAFGNSELSRYTRTFAHELGHLFGLPHNNRTIVQVGVDVDNRLGLGRIKPTSHRDIMVAGLLTNQAWVDVQTYTHFYNHALLRCGTGPGSAPGQANGDFLYITGVIDALGHAAFHPAYQLSGARESAEAEHEAEYVVRAVTAHGMAHEYPVAAELDTESGAEVDSGAFGLTLPADTREVTIARDGVVLDVLRRSPHAPRIEHLGSPAVLSGSSAVSWVAADADGDALHASLLYSPDGGQSFAPVAVNETAGRVVFDAGYLQPSAHGVLRLLVTDGMNTTTVERPVVVA